MLKKRAKPRSIVILGRRWFQRSSGNTYHTVLISVDGLAVHGSDRTYGYEDHYRQTAVEWLQGDGYLPESYGTVLNVRQYCEDNAIEYTESVSDVSRKSDLC